MLCSTIAVAFKLEDEPTLRKEEKGGSSAAQSMNKREAHIYNPLRE
jgi:hypothetical protein